MKKAISIFIIVFAFLSTGYSQTGIDSVKTGDSKHHDHFSHGEKMGHHKSFRLFHKHKHHHGNHHGDKSHGYHGKGKRGKY